MRSLFAAFLAVAVLFSTAGAEAETRVAMVVGNGAYQGAPPLSNPVNDAQDVAAALTAAGFKVVLALDTDRRKFDAALRAFADELGKADVALFFYAGHGLQVGQQNYLVPIDAKLERERDLEFEAVSLDFVLRQLEIEREGKTTIVFLDACRDNPLARNLARSMGTRSTAIGRGLAPANTGLGTFIAFSTQPGNVALDGDGRNSPFAAALVKHIGAKGRSLPATMIEVRKEVIAVTAGRQVPWDHSAMTGDFVFVPGDTTPQQGSVAAPPAATGVDIAALQERLRKLEEEARKREADAGNPPQPRPPQPSPPQPMPLQPSAPTHNMPPVLPKAAGKPPSALAITDNVRIDGLKIREERLPSPVACRDACDREEGCAGFQHGRRQPVMGLCQLFARVDARTEDPAWRSGVRLAAVPREAAVPAHATGTRLAEKIGIPMTRVEKGFQIYEGVAARGEQIKMAASDSPAGCQAICRNTPGCVAVSYDDFFRGKNVACLVFRDITGTMTSSSAMIMLRAE